jgi:hypothetical protein
MPPASEFGLHPRARRNRNIVLMVPESGKFEHFASVGSSSIMAAPNHHAIGTTIAVE